MVVSEVLLGKAKAEASNDRRIKKMTLYRCK